MILRSEKGFTGIDTIVAILSLFIFVAIIAVLSSEYTNSIKVMERQTEAMYHAISEIEKVKSDNISKYNGIIANEYVQDESGSEINSIPILDSSNEETGYFLTKEVKDYNQVNSSADEEYMKIITVTVEYRLNGEDQSVELSTVVTK